MTEKPKFSLRPSRAGTTFVADAGEHPADCPCCVPALANAEPASRKFPIPPARLSGNAARQYHGSNLPVIRGTPQQKLDGVGNFQLKTGRARQALERLVPRNKEARLGPDSGQEYLCLGCDVRDGDLRAQILMLAASPLYQRVMLDVYHTPLALQCYFAKTYEKDAETKPGFSVGPGGVIGVMPEAFQVPLATSAARAHKMWHWVDANEPGHLPEAEAEEALRYQALTQLLPGLEYLQRLPDILPAQGEAYPPELRHDLMALLGVPAMRRVIAETLKREVVLIDDQRLTTTDQLHWSQLT